MKKNFDQKTLWAAVLLLALITLVGQCQKSTNAVAEAPPPAPSWGLIDGLFTDANGNKFDLTELAARTADAQNVTSDMLIVEVDGDILTEGAEILPDKTAQITMTIPAGKNAYGFPGGNTGGAWIKNATITGADSCEIFNQPGTIQFNCAPGTEERIVVINATTTQEFLLPPPVGNWPYSTLVINPSPEGAEAYYQWQGVWGEITHILHLPFIVNGN